MSLARDAVIALRNIVLIEGRLRKLTEQVRQMDGDCQAIKERLARLEGKFELLERLGSARPRRLPAE
jgi:DNA anti-recombination protein RmuC